MTRIDTTWPERRSERLHIRISPDFKHRLEEAARETGVSVSDFVVSAAGEQMDRVLDQPEKTASVPGAELANAVGAEHAEAINRMAADQGRNPADVIAQLLDLALAGGHDLDSDLAAIDASFGAYRDIDVVSREADERARHLEQMWHATP